MEFLLKIRWRPEIGDPSVMGWFTVVAYAAGAVMAWRVWSANRDKRWFGVALLMLALGLNKQLDLQSLVTDIGREVARHGGWYEERRSFQKGFVLAVLGAAGITGIWAVRRYHGSLLGNKLLAAGLFFLLTFIVVRAISFHHFVLSSSVAGFRMNWALELSGILLIGVAACRERRANPPAGKGMASQRMDPGA